MVVILYLVVLVVVLIPLVVLLVLDSSVQVYDLSQQGAIYARGVKDEADRELLSEELAHIKKVDTGDAPLKLKPKTEVKIDLGRSPDFSDLFLMKKMYDIKLSRMVAKPRDLN